MYRPEISNKENVPSLSIFFPAYNDSASIERLVEAAIATASKLTSNFEIIVVNDGSEDNTAEIVTSLTAVRPQLKLVHHLSNQGYGAALISGFSAASGEWIFYTDGDGQYDVSELSHLWKYREANVGLINGYKTNRSDSWVRVVIGKLYLAMVRTLFQLRVKDVDCDFRLVHKSTIDKIKLTCRSGAICAELVRKIQDTDCEIREVGVAHYPRISGTSRFFRPTQLLSTLYELPILWLTLFLKPKLRSLVTFFRAPHLSQFQAN